MFAERALSIDADLDRLREAREWAARVASEFGFSGGDCYQVKVAMSEAVANAIQHGSRGREDPIRISAREEDGGLAFEVADTGVFLSPERPRDELAERGRGLELVALMMDEVRMTPGDPGTRLCFLKRLETGGLSA